MPKVIKHNLQNNCLEHHLSLAVCLYFSCVRQIIRQGCLSARRACPGRGRLQEGCGCQSLIAAGMEGAVRAAQLPIRRHPCLY